MITFRSLVILLPLLSCAAPGPTDPSDLLSLPVSDREEIPPDELASMLGRTVDTVEGAGDLILHLIDSQPGRRMVFTVDANGEFEPSRYGITFISDGFSDDSVQGVRLDLTLERTPDDRWRMSSAKRSFRCAPGRGHITFSTDLCR